MSQQEPRVTGAPFMGHKGLYEKIEIFPDSKSFKKVAKEKTDEQIYGNFVGEGRTAFHGSL